MKSVPSAFGIRPGAEPLGYIVFGSFGSEAQSCFVVDVVERGAGVVSADDDGADEDSDSLFSLACSVVVAGRGVNAGSLTEAELLAAQEVSKRANGMAPAISILRVLVTEAV